MGTLTTQKQTILDTWATNVAKGVDVGKVEYELNGTTVKPSATDAMMQALQGELTESVLDAAIAKAKKDVVDGKVK